MYDYSRQETPSVVAVWLHIATAVPGTTWDQYYNHMPIDVVEATCKWINQHMERGFLGNQEVIAYKAIARTKGVKFE